MRVPRTRENKTEGTREERERLVNVTRGAVVVAQLVERSIPVPEVRGSNPVIGKKLFIH